MSLLLLPVLSPPVSRSSWWTAYRDSLNQALKTLKPSDEREIARLDVAVLLTQNFPQSADRSSAYTLFQDLLREVYSLICVCAGQSNVDLDFPGGIDARVFFIDLRSSDEADTAVGKRFFAGPVIDIQTFIKARRPYSMIYSVDGEAGEACLKAILELWQESSLSPPVERLPRGPSLTSPKDALNPTSTSPAGRVHRSVANGGTFDHLHIGHKLLLAATAYLAEPHSTNSTAVKRTITIGITGDELLVNKKHGALVESWGERQQRTAEFLDSIFVFHPNIANVRTVQETDDPGPNGKNVKVKYGNEVEINYTRISDPFGPTITDENITALVISAETRAGGKAVNDKRTEKGWKPLEVFEVDVLDAEVPEEYAGMPAIGQTFENKISSTDIRKRLEAKTKITNGRL